MKLNIPPHNIRYGVSSAYEAVERKIVENRTIYGIKIKLLPDDSYITFWFDTVSDRMSFVNRIVQAVNR